MIVGIIFIIIVFLKLNCMNIGVIDGGIDIILEGNLVIFNIILII